jgi:hypothetical protein
MNDDVDNLEFGSDELRLLDVSCGASLLMYDSVDDLESDSDEFMSFGVQCRVAFTMYAFATKVDGSAF